MTFKATLRAASSAADIIYLNDCELDSSGLYEAGGKTYCRFERDDTDWYLPADQEVEVNEFGEAYAVAYATPEDDSDAESVALTFKVDAPLRSTDLCSAGTDSQAA